MMPIQHCYYKAGSVNDCPTISKCLQHLRITIVSATSLIAVRKYVAEATEGGRVILAQFVGAIHHHGGKNMRQQVTLRPDLGSGE